MKLESLHLAKFQGNALKRAQMFTLSGGDTATPGGHKDCGIHNGQAASFDYGYDAIRDGGVITYHNRSNVKYSLSIAP